MPWIVSMLNQKGGVGKTTTTMSLAAVTAERADPAQKVLVLDVDPQDGSSAYWAEHAEQSGNELPFYYDFTEDLDALQHMRGVDDYDVIFVDTPGSLANMDVVRTIVSNSDYVILPTEPSTLALASLAQTIQLVLAPAGIPYRVLLNKVKTSRTSGYRTVFDTLEEMKIPHFKSFVRDYAAHERAPEEGLVVTQYPRTRENKKAVGDYMGVAAEMWQDWASLAASPAATSTPAASSAPAAMEG